jgi:hypothetical protein
MRASGEAIDVLRLEPPLGPYSVHHVPYPYLIGDGLGRTTVDRDGQHRGAKALRLLVDFAPEASNINGLK